MRWMKAFLTERSGNFAMISALLSVPLVLSAGLAIDYSRHVSSSRHLQELADAAALSLAASKERDETKLTAMALEIVESNRNASRVSAVSVADLIATDEAVDLKLNGEIPATFMGIAGYDKLPSSVSALAERAVRGNVEIALVLDNTWSMSETDARGYAKIDTLKTAASKLVNELMQNNDGAVRIGLVPYADYVNVGTQHRNASWLDVPADYTTTPEPRTCEWRNTKTVCDRQEPSATCTRVVDGMTETYSCGGGCVPGYSRQVQVEPYQVCWGGGEGTSYTWYGCVGSRKTSDNRLHDRNPGVRYPGFVETQYKCPNPIVALTTDKSKLVKAVNDMVISRGSYYRPYTYIPAGLIWGLNVLSPGEPFGEGAAYDAANAKPRKVAVLMTDGENTLRFNSGDGRHARPSGSAANQQSQLNQTNDDTVAICQTMKSKGIEIFSIAFMVDDPAAKTILEGCATDEQHYFDASDSAALLAAFSEIGASLRVVRLAR